MTLDDLFHHHAPPTWARMYFRARFAWRRVWRRLRYRRMPDGGWGQGWRVLVFRLYTAPPQELHVLAPVNGDNFDWPRLRTHVRGEPWPVHEHAAGVLTGALDWQGHHTWVVIDGFEPQRLSMGKLAPGEFGGGVDVGMVLVDVREAAVTD